MPFGRGRGEFCRPEQAQRRSGIGVFSRDSLPEPRCACSGLHSESRPTVPNSLFVLYRVDGVFERFVEFPDLVEIRKFENLPRDG